MKSCSGTFGSEVRAVTCERTENRLPERQRPRTDDQGQSQLLAIGSKADNWRLMSHDCFAIYSQNLNSGFLLDEFCCPNERPQKNL